MIRDICGRRPRHLERPPYPTGFEPNMRRVTSIVSESAEGRARWASRREGLRTSWVSPSRLPPPSDPFEQWLWAVEDACFAAGREWEGMVRVQRRPHWRLWDFAQLMALRYARDSRLRQLLEPDDAEDEETGYRTLWINRWPRWPQWDFALRLLWFYARDSRLRHWLAPDKPAEP
jgi:hypothetical protein